MKFKAQIFGVISYLDGEIIKRGALVNVAFLCYLTLFNRFIDCLLDFSLAQYIFIILYTSKC